MFENRRKGPECGKKLTIRLPKCCHNSLDGDA